MGMQTNSTYQLPHNNNASGIYGYYAGTAQQSGMPQAFGNGQVASWLPRGTGQLSEELSALLRVAAHDAYSGVDRNGHSYIDGDLGIKALFFPDDPVVKPLLDKPYLKKALWQYTLMDIQDDRQINGSPARRIFADAMWQGWGIDMSRQLQRAPLRRADLSMQALSQPNVNNGEPKGFEIQAQWLGLSNNQFAAFVTAFHDFLPKPLDDRMANGSALVNALRNPMHPDYKNTNGVPGLRNYFQNLINRDRQQFGQLNGWNLAHDAANAMLKMFFR